MKISEVTIQEVKDYAHIYHDEDDLLLKTIISGAISYIKNYTGLDDDKLDEKEDLSIALLVLCNEMYDKRSYTADNDKVNIVIKSILDMHSINLL